VPFVDYEHRQCSHPRKLLEQSGDRVSLAEIAITGVHKRLWPKFSSVHMMERCLRFFSATARTLFLFLLSHTLLHRNGIVVRRHSKKVKGR
jgi:hypothetical protein